MFILNSLEKNILFIVSIEGWYKWPLEDNKSPSTSSTDTKGETSSRDIKDEVLPLLDFAGLKQDLFDRLECRIYADKLDEFKKIFFDSIELKEIKPYSNTANNINVAIQSKRASTLYIQIMSKGLVEFLKRPDQHFKEGPPIIYLLEFLESSLGLHYESSKKRNNPAPYRLKSSNVIIVSHDCSMRWLVGDYEMIKRGQWYPSKTRCFNQQILDYDLLKLPASTKEALTHHSLTNRLSNFAAGHDHCSQNYKSLQPGDPKQSTLFRRLSLPLLRDLYVCRTCYNAVSLVSPSNSNRNALNSTYSTDVKRSVLYIRATDSWKEKKSTLSKLEYDEKGKIHVNPIRVFYYGKNNFFNCS